MTGGGLNAVHSKYRAASAPSPGTGRTGWRKARPAPDTGVYGGRASRSQRGFNRRSSETTKAGRKSESAALVIALPPFGDRCRRDKLAFPSGRSPVTALAQGILAQAPNSHRACSSLMSNR